MLRTTPNLVVLRPADINEVIGSWDFVVNNKRPVALVLAKDEAHILAGTSGESVKYGAYIVKQESSQLDAVLVSTGIDLTNTYLAAEELRRKGIDTRVVSMPSVELFLSQPEEYQNQVIPPNAKVITVEASSTLPWYRFASKNCAIGIDEFGVSGKKEDVLQKLGFDYASILTKIENNISNN
jgi:transketolase